MSLAIFHFWSDILITKSFYAKEVSESSKSAKTFNCMSPFPIHPKKLFYLKTCQYLVPVFICVIVHFDNIWKNSCMLNIGFGDFNILAILSKKYFVNSAIIAHAGPEM